MNVSSAENKSNLERDQIELCPISFNDSPAYQSLKDFLKTLGLSTGQIKAHLSGPLRNKIIDTSNACLQLPIDLVNSFKVSPHFEAETKPEILRDDDELLVVEKPVRVHSHSQKYSQKNTVHAYLRQNNFSSPLLVNPYEHEKGNLHRLDFETSGVLLLAKTDASFGKFRNLMMEKNCRKIYQVVVEGAYAEDDVLVHEYLKSSNNSSKVHVKRLVQSVGESESFVTHNRIGTLKILKKQVVESDCYKNASQDSGYALNKQLSLLEVELIGGFRHQIRTQLADVGFPILGDSLYGDLKKKDEVNRLFLHSKIYDFGCGYRFESKFDLHSF